ncbi:hypothetical protein [Paludisphaera rhizosphaerae]|uniref:hypothetical protein n=1 Tax=Paludisphaera rhizosphaerae TaxID=2711216 RepID=UPI0013EBB48C|nr:hypothetical protein [Paludisphaera rhizosphaerae]
MKHYRISIDVDIKATDREHAESRANLLYEDIWLCRPGWIEEVLPNGIEERITLKGE